jgi:hypothetical protein
VPALLLVLALWLPGAEAGPDRVGPVPAEVRKALRLDAFYQQHLDVGGFPVLASTRTSPLALQEAAWIIEGMLHERPDVLRALREAKVRCAVMSYQELTTDVPEHKTLEPGRFWDRRARGLGASPERPCVSCAEENLLRYPGDPYASESILVHEFAHAIDLMALRRLDPGFEKKLQATFEAAMKKGLWKGLYAAQNKEEYWAEGVQSWFHANRPPDAIHNHVDTRAELRAYDRALADLIESALGKNEWRYTPPRARPGRLHLSHYDPEKAPRFEWPKALQDWYRRYEAAKKTGEGRVELARLDARGSPSKSPHRLHETRILFVNETKVRLQVFWLDYEGNTKPYGEIPAGQSQEQSTLVGHVWVVRDTNGRELARFVAGATSGRALIR